MTASAPPAVPSPALAKVLRMDLCSGCGLCAALGGAAVRMDRAHGFNRPRVLAAPTPEAERRIAQTCPGLTLPAWGEGADVHPYWGPARSAAVGHATEAPLRHQASSGGVLSALVIAALDSGIIDGCLHVAADPADPMQNIAVISRSAHEVASRCGSRYAPSSPLAIVTELLEAGGRYAFVGKPCDVSALRSLAKIDPRVDATFPLMLSFYCGGIPSRRAAAGLLAAMQVAPDELASFRYRGHGWPGLTTAVRHDGSTAELTYMDSWGGHLSKDVQYRCKICPDAVGGAADIACGDAWYGDDRGYPSFIEQDGRSLIMLRTERGERLYRQCIEDGRLAGEPLPLAEIDKMQPSQARRKRLIRSRLAAMKVVFPSRPGFPGVLVPQAARRATILEEAKSFAGALRRLVQGVLRRGA